MKICRSLCLLGLISLVSARGEGIPEPSLLIYGAIRNVQGGDSFRLTVGQLTWVFQPAGGGPPTVVTASLTNINDQFSYVLRVPCETVLAGLTLSPNALHLAPGSTDYDRSQVTLNGVTATFVQFSQAAISLSSSDRGRIERVDLQVSTALVDSDGDGLPDLWEQQYFGDLRFGANDDPDLDGMSNLAEYRAGTNPNDRNSRFAFIQVQADPEGVLVEWSSVEGELYSLQRSADLLSGFTTIQPNILATAPVNSYRDATALGPGPHFYRVQLQE